MKNYTFSFIGTGNMGSALATAACKGVAGENVLLADKSADRAEALSKALGCHTGSSEDAAKYGRYIFLGVKPQVLSGLIGEISGILKARKDSFTLVTMAAGVSIARLTEMLGFNCPIIRIMPNTPASAGEGMILYDANSLVSNSCADEFINLMSGAGQFDRLEENLIDAGSAVSGCGPAFTYMFIEALADGGVQCGLPRAKAMKYAAQMVLGSARMVLESGRHPGELKDAVCSPGGTTIVGVHALEDGAFRSLAMDAVTSAYDKTIELSKK